MSIPDKISPCPISEAVVELRYETAVPAEAIFGMMYSCFRAEFPIARDLPILQIPGPIRLADPNLKYLPEYRMEGDGFILQVGQRCFSISNTDTYVGWDNFFPRIKAAFEKVKGLEIIRNLHQASIRYINTFEFDIFPKSTIHIEPDLKASRTQMNIQIKSEGNTQILRVANNTEIKIGKKQYMGSVIDIDTIIGAEICEIGDDMYKHISTAHEKEKELFFKLLKPEYLATLNPE